MNRTVKTACPASTESCERRLVYEVLNNDHRDLIGLYAYSSVQSQIIAVLVAHQLRPRMLTATRHPNSGQRRRRSAGVARPGIPALVTAISAAGEGARSTSRHGVDIEKLRRCADHVVRQAHLRQVSRSKVALIAQPPMRHEPEARFEDRPVGWSTCGGYYTGGE